MLHTHWLWYAVAALMLVDAVGYTFGAIGPIRRALNPSEPYWQKRLFLNLMLANQGLYLGAAIPLVGAVVQTQQRGAAFALFGLTLANCIYTLVTVPLFTRARQRARNPARARGGADRYQFYNDLNPPPEGKVQPEDGVIS